MDSDSFWAEAIDRQIDRLRVTLESGEVLPMIFKRFNPEPGLENYSHEALKDYRRDLEARIKQFDNTSRATLGEKQRRIRENILAEIRDTIKASIKSAHYTLVIDTAAETANGTPVILYSAGNDDLTTNVLGQLNLNAPPDKADAKPDKAPAK